MAMLHIVICSNIPLAAKSGLKHHSKCKYELYHSCTYLVCALPEVVHIYLQIYVSWSRNSSVGIATRYGLHDPGIESRCSRFYTIVQTSSEAHPASCTMGIGSVSVVMRPERGVDHQPCLAQRLK